MNVDALDIQLDAVNRCDSERNKRRMVHQLRASGHLIVKDRFGYRRATAEEAQDFMTKITEHAKSELFVAHRVLGGQRMKELLGQMATELSQ